MDEVTLVRELGTTAVLLIVLRYWHVRGLARDEQSAKAIDKLCDLVEKCIDCQQKKQS